MFISLEHKQQLHKKLSKTKNISPEMPVFLPEHKNIHKNIILMQKKNAHFIRAQRTSKQVVKNYKLPVLNPHNEKSTLHSETNNKCS